MTGDEYRSNFHPIMVKVAVYFTALLVNIKYWKVTRRPERIVSFGMNDDFVRSPNELYGNEVVYVCMVMEHLTIHGRSNAGACDTYSEKKGLAARNKGRTAVTKVSGWNRRP
ncbi:hypothetical protein R6Q57_025384 [Mikania cordata]